MKLNRIRASLSNPAQRRAILTVTSGSLILLGFLLPLLLGGPAGLRHIFFIAAAVIAGSDIAVRGIRALLQKQVGIELLVTVAATGALVIGETWEAAAVTFLFLFGAYLEARTLRRTRAALKDLLDLAPPTATVLRRGRQETVSPHEVEVGETVLVKPGGRLPVDGVVLGGDSFVDESSITGEPLAARKSVGADVFAGTVNGAGMLEIRAIGIGADTTLARIIRRVEEAQEEKAPAQRFIERFARWYTPFVIVLALAAWVVTRDIRLALTLLVIGCPGALVISTPVSVVAGIGRAARRGILIKGGEHLERAGKITALALDKTGTITSGRPRITDVVPFATGFDLPDPGLSAPDMPASFDRSAPFGPAQPFRPSPSGGVGVTSTSSDGGVMVADRSRTAEFAQGALIQWAAIAEQGSEHPLAKPILEAASPGFLPMPDAFESSTGRGVQALYRGHSIAVGNEALMSQLAIPVDSRARRELLRLQETACTPVLVAIDGSLVGLIGIADPAREGAAGVIATLRRRLNRVLMLTGDNEATARAVADEVGIDEVRAGLLPEEKLAAIRELQSQGEVVAMLGDGVNDSPALAAADVGIAMGAGGSDVAIETADIALISDDLSKLPEAIGISRKTLRNIRQNVAIALLTVAGLLAGVLMGEVHMAGGMLIHQASVMLVIANAMRLLRA